MEFVVSVVDGDTTSNATRSCRSTVGARYANMMRKREVNAKIGARYSVTAFETPAIMTVKREVTVRGIQKVVQKTTPG